MARLARSVGTAFVVLFAAGGGSAGQRAAPPGQGRGEMPREVRRLHERLVASTKGEADLADLRLEIFEGSGLAHRSARIEAGTLFVEEWPAPGEPPVRREGRVSDERLVRLLEELVELRYWTFEGTRFVPDAPTFLFRFRYGGEEPVDFRCDLDELARSKERTAIRDLLLRFVAETETKRVPRR